MARRSSTALARYTPPRPRAARPIVVRVGAAKPAKKHHRRHHGKFSGMPKDAMLWGAVGGYAVGFIEKQFPTLPTLPVIGKKGAIALAVYFLKPSNKILKNIGFAAAVLAGNEFAATGKVSGSGVVRQV